MKQDSFLIASMVLTLPESGYAAPSDTVAFAGHKWRVEAEPSSPETIVTVNDGAMSVSAARGVTVLLLKKLRGTYCIRYTREVLPSQGTIFRVSDLNQFWLIDPRPLQAPAVRDGRFKSYTPDSLFYVGIGGNNNTTSRFRHYDGSAARPLLAESDMRLEPGRRYDLRTCVLPDRTEFYIDGKRLFSAAQTPPPFSYFALRSTGSKQVVTNFRIEHR
ncbi:DUF6250 domain-containing protein [Sphingomonas sp. ac-8]|uniref:DUF6250 domain-containing protein n=1 Tax=Sphingomonas sp. ac-8 TaxID=3242977 RepID=UPI003A813A9D